MQGRLEDAAFLIGCEVVMFTRHLSCSSCPVLVIYVHCNAVCTYDYYVDSYDIVAC